MNILWITNIPFGKLIGLAGLIGENTGGSWLNAALNDFVGESRFSLTVVTIGRVDTIKTLTEDNITYCLLPGGFPLEYNQKKDKNIKNWQYVKDSFKPDIVHVWGTEFSHGYLALKVMQGIPSVVYIQGLLESISRYYLAGMSEKELKRNITFRDILKLDWLKRAQTKCEVRSLIEAEIINISGNVIVENRWCASHCLNINNKCNIYKCELNIKEDFFKIKWAKENTEPYTIMCNAAGYSIKGLHILLKALSRVVQKYPKTKLFIPGDIIILKKSLLERIKEDGYTQFIKKLIIKFNLEKNIVFLGRLSSENMAKHMSTTNVFVMPSSIENHSSTLIEAMIVGAPCVASYVGGIPEYVTHKENGLLYRFEEYEMLAEHIIDLFTDLDYAAKLGSNARNSMWLARSSVDLKEKLISIYNKIINTKNELIT
jgi:glycosyltransferase involved in cell wall biosynthesis